MNPAVLWALRWHLFLSPLLFGFTPRFLSGFRTNAEQVAFFRSPPSQNPVAFPGTSQHEFGLAYDLAPDVFSGSSQYTAKLAQLRQLGLALGMRWGGPNDPQHWQAFSHEVWQAIISSFPGGQAGVRQGVA